MNFFWVEVKVTVNFTQSFQLQLLLSYWKYHWTMPSRSRLTLISVHCRHVLIVLNSMLNVPIITYGNMETGTRPGTFNTESQQGQAWTWWTSLSTSSCWSYTMEEARPKFCNASGSQGSASPSSRRTSGGPTYSRTLRCTSIGPTSSQSCSMCVRHGPRQQDPGKASRCLRHLVCAENFTDSVHQAHYKWQSGASRAACQSLKRSSRSDWGFSGTWLDQLQRITLPSPLRFDQHLIGRDLQVVQDPPGWE